MAHRHTKDKLEPDVADLIERLLKRPRGVDEFTEMANAILEERGSDIRLSRSAAHRWMQTFEAERQAMRETNEITRAFAAELGEIPDTDSGCLLVEMLRTVIFKVLRPQLSGRDPTAGAQDLMMLGRALRDSTAVLKGSVELQIKIRREVADKMMGRLDRAEKDAQAAGEKGLSAERVAQLRREFLGVRDQGTA